MFKNTNGPLLILIFIVLLTGCSNGNKAESTELNKDISNVREEQIIDEINLIKSDNKELERRLTELERELEKQTELLRLLPQSWQVADRFLDAYVSLDYEILSELTVNEYLIEEDGIIFEELDTKTPYLSQHNDNLTYLLNNFEVLENSSNPEVAMNVIFYIYSKDSIAVEGIVFMNLTLEKIKEEWRVTKVDL